MLKVFICGGSGYAGGELLRILSGHPEVVVTGVTSERSAGKSVTELFPHLNKYSKLIYEPLRKEEILGKADLFFMALPHGESQEAVDFFFRNGKTVIDLSADYRLRDRGDLRKMVSSAAQISGNAEKGGLWPARNLPEPDQEGKTDSESGLLSNGRHTRTSARCKK